MSSKTILKLFFILKTAFNQFLYSSAGQQILPSSLAMLPGRKLKTPGREQGEEKKREEKREEKRKRKEEKKKKRKKKRAYLKHCMHFISLSCYLPATLILDLIFILKK